MSKINANIFYDLIWLPRGADETSEIKRIVNIMNISLHTEKTIINLSIKK